MVRKNQTLRFPSVRELKNSFRIHGMTSQYLYQLRGRQKHFYEKSIDKRAAQFETVVR